MESSKGAVLDTDILIDFLRGRKSAVGLIKELRESLALATTSINLFELSWGASKLSKDKFRSVLNLASKLRVLNLTGHEAIKAGEEMAYLETLGSSINIRDLMIGIIARENNYKLVTGNIKHFKRIRGLEVIEYKKESV